MHAEPTQMLSRRGFLATGVASAAALALGADTPETGPYGPFKMGLQSYSLREFALEEALDKTQDLGLEYWESFRAHIPPDPGQATTYRNKAIEADIKVIGFGVVPFKNDQAAVRRLFDFGRLMGIEYFSADPDPDAFDLLDKMVETYGIAVGIHNHGPGHRWGKIDTIRDAIKDHHKKIGCCIDTGHFLRAREDPVRAVEVFHDRIYGVHLKDVKDATKFTILGEGDLKTADLLRALTRRKYNYCLALEYEENPKNPIEDIKACLAAVRKAAAQL
ncbi:MAG: sugar phosphate isomerase/epimerase [Isosphaeraceae bacterium]|nr:sugar phosphate isomerase/epimerase [Isosphaeraceae bacterium]